MPCSVSTEEIILLSAEILSPRKVLNNEKPAPHPLVLLNFPSDLVNNSSK